MGRFFTQTDRPILKYGAKYVVQLVLKTAYVALFMMLPRYLLARFMPGGADAYPVNNSYIYFALFMSGICGSINNSVIFRRDSDTDAAKENRPSGISAFFRGRILENSLYEFFAFMPAFAIFGMNFAKAFYLSLVIVLMRFMGHTFNILMYRALGKSLSMIKGADITVMVFSILAAYYVPYAIGYVPDAGAVLFDTTTFTLFMVVSSVFMYYVWNYHGYGRIFNTVCEDESLADPAEKERSLDEELRHIEEEEVFTSESYQRINRLFFVERIKDILGRMGARIIMCFLALAAAIIAGAAGQQQMIGTIIGYSMSALPFIMLAMNVSGDLCRDMYYDCDVRLLAHREYRRKNDVMDNFIQRLRCLLVFDMVPAGVLSVVYMIAGMIAKDECDRITLVSVCVGIIVLALFFTIFRLVMYYVLQPYSADRKKGNRVHFAINIVLYLLCAGIVYIDAPAVRFTFVAGLILGGFTIISVLCMELTAYRAFKLKK